MLGGALGLEDIAVYTGQMLSSPRNSQPGEEDKNLTNHHTNNGTISMSGKGYGRCV